MSHSSPERRSVPADDDNSPHGSLSSRSAAIDAAFGAPKQQPVEVSGATLARSWDEPQAANRQEMLAKDTGVELPADPATQPPSSEEGYQAPNPPLTDAQMDAALHYLVLRLNQHNGE